MSPEKSRLPSPNDVAWIAKFDHTGMLFAVIERSPVFGGSIGSVDDSAARAVPGVIAVVPINADVVPEFEGPVGWLLYYHPPVNAFNRRMVADVAVGDRVHKQGVLASVMDRIDETVLAAAPGLKVVSNIAVGTNNVDIPACTKRGTTSWPRMNPVLAMSTIRPSMTALVSRMPPSSSQPMPARPGPHPPEPVR